MKIESFIIRNFRSIKDLQLRNLDAINVFFGKNNVGKSNILRALHLAFYCLRSSEIYLPETMFFSRNIYRPIEIEMDLDLYKGFREPEGISNALKDAIENISSVPDIKNETSDELANELDQFVEMSYSFTPLRKVHLKVRLGYSEETSDIGILIEAPEVNHTFDYEAYRTTYSKLEKLVTRKRFFEIEQAFKSISIELSRVGIDMDEVDPFFRRPRRYKIESDDIDMMLARLQRYVSKIDDLDKREYSMVLLDRYREKLKQPKSEIVESFSKVFDIVKDYFQTISESFILIPNKEYFLRGPFNERDGERIQIFNMDNFLDRLLSFIESPNTIGRGLVRKFYSVFNESYSDLGRLESITKLRDEVFAIFGTNLTSLPIADQGLGIQDLFLYLANMILFDPAIVAIEEPEGGLSMENQIRLRNIINDIYLEDDKQIFISSHSEEFETKNSYIIEMGSEGTKEIGRVEKKDEYEEKIDKILISKKLEAEKTQLEAILRNVSEKQMTLDILNYINNLGDEEEINPQEIAEKLGYKTEKVQKILTQVARKK